MADRIIRLLGVHGVGDNPVGGAWEGDWRDAITAGMGSVAADVRPLATFVSYQDLFDRVDLDFWAVARAVSMLVRSAVSAPARGVASLSDPVRKTAGMVVAWVENEAFRRGTRERLAAAIDAGKPAAVLAHSLGSLVAYDTFTHPDTRDRVAGMKLVTFGSQLANSFVTGQFLAGRLAVPEACSHWYHLFNPEDAVFTERFRISDERFTFVEAHFDDPGPLDHAATSYLKHANTAAHVWWPLAQPRQARGFEQGRYQRRLAPKVARLSTARHRAVLVGINDYPAEKDRLAGCVNDVFLMSSVLQEAGLDAEDIRVVLDGRATARGIRSRVEWLLDDVHAGDRRILYYSGHGAQIPTYGVAGRTEESKETLVPHDFDWSEETALTDDWFHQVYSQLPYDCEFMAIFDCCHSGGMTRAGGPRAKGIDPPDDLRHRTLRWNAERDMWEDRELEARNRRFQQDKSPSRGEAQITDRLGFGMQLRRLSKRRFEARKRSLGHKGPYMPILLYACREDELAYEYTHGAVAHGAFTFSLAKNLRREVRERRQRPSYSDLVRLVQRDMRGLGFDQLPALAGPTEKKRELLPFLAPPGASRNRKER